jgi:hypothetical protein
MSELRELTDAELDFVGGGLAAPRPRPTGGGELKLAEEILVLVLRAIEGNRFTQPAPVAAK